MATTLADDIQQNLWALVTLTNGERSEKYTNNVRADLNIRIIPPTTLPQLQAQTEEDTSRDEEDNTSSAEHNSEEE